MNRNLHTQNKLTEFSREFEEEPETLFSKLVNKVSSAYNSNYNTINIIPPTSIPSINELTGGEASSSSSSHLGQPSVETKINTTSPSVSDNTSIDDKSDDSNNIGGSEDSKSSNNVFQMIGNLIPLKNNNLHSYKDTEFQRFWMPDSKSKECYECSMKFTTFRRKHHCRLCGQIFCSKCCNQVVPGKIINCSDDLKVCTHCSKKVLTHLKSSTINPDSDLQVLRDDLSNKLCETHNSQNYIDELQEPNSSYNRKVSVGYQEERFVSTPNVVLSNAYRKTCLQQSNSLKMLYDDMVRVLPNQNKGCDFTSFLISNQKSSNKVQSNAILNAMIEAGFLINVVPTDDELIPNFDENLFYRLLRKDDFMSNSGSFQLDLNFEANSVQLTRPNNDNIIVDVVPLIDPNDSNFGYQTAKKFELENTLLSTSGSRPFVEAFCEHEEILLHQLLRNENLDQNWSKILIQICARIANTLKPDMMDIRNFVNFKKVPGGQRKDSYIIGGVVFSKNVVHKDMLSKIEKPRILLLQCAIVYQRVEGKFISLESLLLQENEYLRNVTTRILSLKPNVVLVHKNVSGIAQDMLRNHGITLVLDVKLTVLERLARCLQCDIVSSIDSNIGRPKLGICDLFYIKNFTDEICKTVMFFETASSPRGCCVLLRGGNNQELTRVKRVASTLLFARYNWRLELSYLLDEFACPPFPKPGIFDSKEQSPCIDAELLNVEEEHKKMENIPKIKKIEDKIVNKENVKDFSDPLRSTTDENILESSEESIVVFQTPYDNRFRSALSSTILSISPFVVFPLPYLETELGRKCILRSHFPNELYYSKQWSEFEINDKHISQDSRLDKGNIELLKVHDFVSHKITTSIDNRDLQSLVSYFRAGGGRLPKKGTMKKILKTSEQPIPTQKVIEELFYKDALDLANHQRLSVLFCSYYQSSKVPSSFCAQPSLLNMQFYGQNDIMLGSFLERYCFRNSYICPSCNLPMLDHVRRYVHSNGCVLVQLAEDVKKNETGSILMTSWCSICNATTPSVKVANDTWCLSFAKYLELKFHGHAYKRRSVDGEGDIICKHSLHRDYVQYFSYDGIVASFKYYPIETWEIGLPPLIVQLKKPRPFDNSKVLEDIKNFAQKGYDVYANIFDRIAVLSNDGEFPMLPTLKILINRDQQLFKKRVEVVQTLLIETIVNPYDINDAMLMVKRTLAESHELWGPRLHEASIQIKNIVKSDGPLQIDPGTICTEDLVINNSDGDFKSRDKKSIENKELSEQTNVITESFNSVDDLSRSEDNILSKSQETELITQAERSSKEIYDKKTLKSILSQILPSTGNSNTLPSPLSSHEYHNLPLGLFPILVHDQDLSSIIAYSLISPEYKTSLSNLNNSGNNSDVNSSPNLKRKCNNDSNPDTEEKDTNFEKKNKFLSHMEIMFQETSSSSYTSFTCKIYFVKEFDQMRMNFLNPPKMYETNSDKKNVKRHSSQPDFNTRTNKENENNERKNSNSGSKIEIYQEEDIRKAFARSLCRSIRWDAKGGKSGSKFSKTLDDRFVLKEMSKTEVTIFENFAPNYFEYIKQCQSNSQPTLLAMIFGVFKVTIKKKDNVQEKCVLIMENLFCDRDISNKFDLKGSERNRMVDPSNQNNQNGEIVLLDENLIQMSWSKPLYILTHSRTILREAINRDASFLEKNDVMDYSLLVGMDTKENVLILGIIDYIRTYTLDKKIESIVKQSGILGGQGKLPTVVAPKLYKQRFSEAMERYFLVVPDRWDGLSKK